MGWKIVAVEIGFYRRVLKIPLGGSSKKERILKVNDNRKNNLSHQKFFGHITREVDLENIALMGPMEVTIDSGSQRAICMTIICGWTSELGWRETLLKGEAHVRGSCGEPWRDAAHRRRIMRLPLLSILLFLGSDIPYS